ncbi:biotin carboxylase N-terminal domain-containing protein [Rhizobium sp. SSA_523]|uniref:acetyl/propionyl/methylcrotonyl-CoA carboxylase subunit alpha n=1 Tax=Rhizobium sp. SSA_523 TaxID=2952477 RepID=UPI00209047FB|nr:biotin carboxylase N-terminal domain-containing protein [Rhizobium sp. SSA_523]MCO5732594.1 ATP-grasp domain-containing protein [Rhizobium sp. SSA_523]WKC23767.1 biotin carboxylase N-terminal domain-containing protein [Rhizobium sp. SSA_523]
MKKVLIANRGEIAVRIIRACRDYGLRSVAAYADADADAMFVRQADEAYALDGVNPKDSYLDIDKIIRIARRTGADAVHPGYGFLSERAEFAEAVIEAGLVWIGPDPHVIAALGDKLKAREIARQVGAPLVAGSEGAIDNAAEALAFARRFGLPIAIKAAHGGGGRGLKIARALEEVEESFHSARREALAAFGRGECYVEQFLDRPRHIEAQILADRHGHVLVVGTRDCSLQRRNQKLVEEAPAPFLTPDQRGLIHKAASDICAAVGYVGAGTVEFLLSASGVISFLEVNTRLQVEHPVTEETTGLDLVVEQFRIAEGLPISRTQMPEPNGHAIEFRINVEDPARGFLPFSGDISTFVAPAGPGIRLDSGVAQGSSVPSMFDSLIAKLVVWGPDRKTALARARRALAEFEIGGVPTVLPFHRAVVDHPDFTGEAFCVHTRWIETDFSEHLEAQLRPAAPDHQSMISVSVEIDGKRSSLRLSESLLGLFGRAGSQPAAAADMADMAGMANKDETALYSPVPGNLTHWTHADGDQVEEGAVLAVLDAMKMETTIVAPHAGTLKIIAKPGSLQKAGAVIAHILPSHNAATSLPSPQGQPEASQ